MTADPKLRQPVEKQIDHSIVLDLQPFSGILVQGRELCIEMPKFRSRTYIVTSEQAGVFQSIET